MLIIIFKFLKDHGTNKVIKSVIVSLVASLVNWCLWICGSFELIIKAAEILLHECLFFFWCLFRIFEGLHQCGRVSGGVTEMLKMSEFGAFRRSVRIVTFVPLVIRFRFTFFGDGPIWRMEMFWREINSWLLSIAPVIRSMPAEKSICAMICWFLDYFCFVL